jgi:hypothetical protein
VNSDKEGMNMRETSPEFSLEYEQQQHFRRLREYRPLPNAKCRKPEQRILDLRTVNRIEIIQMADLPRYHYEVWADFEDGSSELLQREYVHGLKNAVRLSREKWGDHRIEFCRWHPKRHRPVKVLSQ